LLFGKSSAVVIRGNSGVVLKPAEPTTCLKVVHWRNCTTHCRHFYTCLIWILFTHLFVCLL